MDLINLSENFKYGIDYLTPDLALQIANGHIKAIINAVTPFPHSLLGILKQRPTTTMIRPMEGR